MLMIAFIYGISSQQIRENKRCKWYLVYLGFFLGIEIFVLSSIYIFKRETTQNLYPIYTTGEFLILTKFFLAELKTTKKWRIVFKLIACYIFIETTILWLMNKDATTGYSKAISTLIIISLLAIVLIKNLKNLEKNNPLLIIYSSLFLYYGVTLFLFLLLNQLTDVNISIWMINNILVSILYGNSLYTFYRLKKCL